MSEKAKAASPSVSSGRSGSVRASELEVPSSPRSSRRISRAVSSPSVGSAGAASATGPSVGSSSPAGTPWTAWLHPLRRWWAARRVRTWLPVRDVLFVCHGNLCRSPYAARAFQERLPEGLSNRIVIDSAGFVGPGRRSPGRAVAVADARGVRLEGHRSRLLDARQVRASDLVVVMEPGQRRAMLRRFGKTRVLLLADLDPRAREGRTIRDPMWQPRETFTEVYARIDRCVEALADLVSG